MVSLKINKIRLRSEIIAVRPDPISRVIGRRKAFVNINDAWGSMMLESCTTSGNHVNVVVQR